MSQYYTQHYWLLLYSGNLITVYSNNRFVWITNFLLSGIMVFVYFLCRFWVSTGNVPENWQKTEKYQLTIFIPVSNFIEITMADGEWWMSHCFCNGALWRISPPMLTSEQWVKYQTPISLFLFLDWKRGQVTGQTIWIPGTLIWHLAAL